MLNKKNPQKNHLKFSLFFGWTPIKVEKIKNKDHGNGKFSGQVDNGKIGDIGDIGDIGEWNVV